MFWLHGGKGKQNISLGSLGLCWCSRACPTLERSHSPLVDHPPTHLRSLPLFVWRVVVVVIGTSCLGKHCERYSMLQCGYNMVGNTMCMCFGGLMCVYAGWGFTLSPSATPHPHTLTPSQSTPLPYPLQRVGTC